MPYPTTVTRELTIISANAYAILMNSSGALASPPSDPAVSTLVSYELAASSNYSRQVAVSSPAIAYNATKLRAEAVFTVTFSVPSGGATQTFDAIALIGNTTSTVGDASGTPVLLQLLTYSSPIQISPGGSQQVTFYVNSGLASAPSVLA